MTSAPIYLTRSGAVGELVLNQPARRNAVNAAMWAAMPDLLAKAERDPGVRVLLVHGGDAGAFAAGADISEFETVYATAERANAYSTSIQHALSALEAFPKPSLAAISGACVGGGCAIALACDLRIADESAKFAITPGKLGLVYGIDDTRRLVAAVGPALAKDLLFTGRMIGAAEAVNCGIATHLAAETDAMFAARAKIDEILAASQWSLEATKRMLAHLKAGETERAQADALFAAAFQSADFAEGYAAFMAKRAPQFRWRSGSEEG